MSVRTEGKSAGGGSDYYVREINPATECGSSTVSSAPTVGRVYYVPVQILHPLTIDAIIVYNAAVAGNRYVGLYNSLGLLPNNLLGTSGSVAVAGVNARQAISLTANLALTIPELYFAAVESSNAGATHLDNFENNPQCAGDGISFYYEDLGVYGALPANATPIQVTVATSSKRLSLRVFSIP